MPTLKLTFDDPDVTLNNEMTVSLDFTNDNGITGAYSGKLYQDADDLPVDVGDAGDPPASPPPTVGSAGVWGSGNGLSLNMSRNVTATAYETFVVTRNGSVDASFYFEAGNTPNKIRGVPAVPMNTKDVMTIDFTNTGSVRGLEDDVAVEDFTDLAVSVADAPVAPPYLDGDAAADSDGKSFVVSFDEDVTATDYTGTWVITVNGDSSQPVTAAAGANPDEVLVSFVDANVFVQSTDTVTLAFTNTGALRGLNTDVEVVSFTGLAVDVTAAPVYFATDFAGETPPGTFALFRSDDPALTVEYVADTNSPTGSDIVVRAKQAVATARNFEVQFCDFDPATDEKWEILGLFRKKATYAYAGLSAMGASLGLSSGVVMAYLYDDVGTPKLRVTGLAATANHSIDLSFPVEDNYIWIRLLFNGTNYQVFAWELGTEEPATPTFEEAPDATMDPTGVAFFGRVKDTTTTDTSECGYFATKVGSLGLSVPEWGSWEIPRYTYEPLEDAYSQNDMVHPQTSTGSGTDGGATDAINSCYDVFVSKDDVVLLSMGDVKALNPNTTTLRYLSGIAYQGYLQADPTRPDPSIPFASSGNASLHDGQMFPGHWAYNPYILSTAALTASASDTALYVVNAQPYVVGEYVCVYDDFADPDGPAEHMLITGKPTATRLTVQRGYKSTIQAHAAGSKVAPHALGQGIDRRLWLYNQSTACPEDANGKKFWQIYSDWLGSYWNVCGNWQTASDLEGLRFDADVHWLGELGKANVSCANTASSDGGFVGGENVWGDGMDLFYAAVRDALPGVILTGGAQGAWGWGDLNGSENEGFPSSLAEAMEIVWEDIPGSLSYSWARNDQDPAPRINQAEFKRPSLLYPQITDTGLLYATDNRMFRVSLAASVMADMVFASHRANISAPGSHIWWDEFAVDVDPESPTFGEATDKDDYATVRDTVHWLGLPVDAAFRIYDESFADENAIYVSDFSSTTDGWSGVNCTVSLDGGALKASQSINPVGTYQGTSIGRTGFPVVTGVDYVVAMKVRASANRRFLPGLFAKTIGTPTNMTTTARWIVTNHRSLKTANQGHTLYFGRDRTDCWLEKFVMFQGSANVMCRKFANGIVYVNYGVDDVEVTLPGAYQRILGTQDPINDGEVLGSKVIVPAQDALFLVKR